MKAKFSKITIPFTEIEPTKVKQQIAQGQNSVIYSTKNPEHVVKFIILDEAKTIVYNKNEQYAYLHLSRHPNLCNSYAYKEITMKDKKYGCYLLENCTNGSLQELVSSLQKSLSESLILEIIYQIASGLAGLHAVTPPITYRDLNLEKVLVGMDGKLKIADFGHISWTQVTEINDINRKIIQTEISNSTQEKFRAPELCDLYSGLPITTASDIWSLGCILYMICYKKHPFEGKLAIINNHYQIPSQPHYSEKVTNLLKMMFKTKPSERAKASDILNYIKTENMGSLFGEFTFSKNVLQGKKNEMIFSNQKIGSEKKEMHVKPKFMDLMNKHFKRLTTKSEGWLLSALEENEEGPKQKYVRYLIIKAWHKNEKVTKFYKFLQKHDQKNIDNCVIIMKSLIVLHNYFKKGPPEALKIKNKEGNPIDILLLINDFWRKVAEGGVQNSKDKKRTPYISSLVYKYSSLLIKKMKLSVKYANFFEGNYSLAPFFSNPRQAPISLTLIDDLLGFLSLLCEFNQCLLNEKALWKIQMSIVISVIDEEYCLVSLLTHLIYALRKATNYIVGKVKEDKLKESIAASMAKFETSFKNIRIFFLNCKNLKDLEERELIPTLKLDALEFLKQTLILEPNATENKTKYNVLKDLSTERNIFDIYIPQSYGKAIKDVKIDEMMSLEESYRNTSPLLSRATIAHSPDYKPGFNPEGGYNYDFTQFLVSKASMEGEIPEKQKAFSVAYNPKEKESESKEQMVYLGFKKGESVTSANLDSQNSKLNENFLEIIKKDERSNDFYSDFSHQQLNKTDFELDKDKEKGEKEKPQYIEESKFHGPAAPMERDDSGENYGDIDPENMINFDNFNKYLNEHVSPKGPEENWSTFDVKHDESGKQCIHVLDVHKKASSRGELKEEKSEVVLTNANLKNEDLLTLAHTFTQELEANKVTVSTQKSQHLVEVGNDSPLKISQLVVEREDAIKPEESIIKKTESVNKSEEKAPPNQATITEISEQMQSTLSQDQVIEENDPIKQLLGDEDISSRATDFF